MPQMVKANKKNNQIWKQFDLLQIYIYILGRGLKIKSWNIKTELAELVVFMHKFAIENDPNP